MAGGRIKGDLCEGPQALQAACHSSSKAALTPHGGEQQAVLGRVGLVGAVGPAKLLDGFVSGPGQLQGEVNSPLLVLGTPALHTYALGTAHQQCLQAGKGGLG